MMYSMDLNNLQGSKTQSESMDLGNFLVGSCIVGFTVVGLTFEVSLFKLV